MSYGSAQRTTRPGSADQTLPRADLLFKADYPRAIDRYIDYFGGLPEAGDQTDVCGESLLDRLA